MSQDKWPLSHRINSFARSNLINPFMPLYLQEEKDLSLRFTAKIKTRQKKLSHFQLGEDLWIKLQKEFRIILICGPWPSKINVVDGRLICYECEIFCWYETIRSPAGGCKDPSGQHGLTVRWTSSSHWTDCRSVSNYDWLCTPHSPVSGTIFRS